MSLKKYTVIAAMGCSVPAGSILALSKKQAARRAHALEDVRKGIYKATQKVSFKCGEEIGFDGDANKVLLSEMELTKNKEKSAKKKDAPEEKPAETSPDGEEGSETGSSESTPDSTP